ncbi:hypothetical protein [Roseivirga sp. E12]|uniref:hypothetical protein n=1 Tax=Roseivirga sp. E12 TaxID=2819237 RepID=UPI001ABD2156|nr:hypothetical protein [Roseivirga sp. E12]MBO3699049.1 hypothetical protein [Roseivirga sp. E12]
MKALSTGQNNMIQYKNLFYSFHCSEIPGFDKIGEAAKALSEIPSNFDRIELQKKTGSDRYKDLRASLDALPDRKEAMEFEAKGHFNKVLSSVKPESESANHKPEEKWSFRPGHIAFNPEFGRLDKLKSLLNEYFDHNCLQAGDFLYPPDGFRLWHTNKFDLESWFIFFVDVDKPKCSFFKFIDPETGELVTHWDEPGTVNIFKINSNNSDLLWHCIGTNDCYRWSQGFSIPGHWKEKLL